MILIEFGPQTAYRMHTPKWAVTPTSGAGTAAHGGRLNRPGTPAVYLSLDHDTAIREYKQVSTLLPPGTLVSYTVAATRVVDFRAGYDSTRWAPLWEDFYCDWRALWFVARTEPPSWVLADEVIAARAKGVLFPSQVGGGVNLVLYTETLDAGDQFQVYDPAGALPKNQESWR